jgi:ABC-2 type transport system permease protein
LQNSAELRTSFLTNIVGMIINNTSFILLWMFFVQSVGVIGGWTTADIIGLNGYTALCYGIILSVGGGIQKLPTYTTTGAFDRFMLSPKNLLLRVATAYFRVSAIGDIFFGVVCLTIYAVLIHASNIQILLMILLIAISTTVFLAALIGINSVCFFFTDADSVSRGLFELFFTPSLFHGGAFQGIMRFIFTFAIPSLLIGALPVEIIRNISVEKLLLVSVLAAFWFIVAIKFFNWSIRKYESSNFMTFGN